CGEPEDFQGQFANKSRGHSAHERSTMGLRQLIRERLVGNGYALKVGQLTYDCRYSTMHGMPVTGGRGFRGLKPLWYNGVPPYVDTLLPQHHGGVHARLLPEVLRQPGVADAMIEALKFKESQNG